MNTRDYLFVYGTLRNDYDLKLKNRVSKDMEYIGKAKVEASLYDLGKYPGAIKEKNKTNEVIGDVFLINDSDKIFKILDKYEGEEFRRKKDQVRLRSGKLLNAWIYWYNLKPDEERKIKYKDYLNYLKKKEK
jgi:gamma-glutamylcyclotransferase (GGCT)/AIG2-like uncharacterized protein YtfP